LPDFTVALRTRCRYLVYSAVTLPLIPFVVLLRSSLRCLLPPVVPVDYVPVTFGSPAALRALVYVLLPRLITPFVVLRFRSRSTVCLIPTRLPCRLILTVRCPWLHCCVSHVTYCRTFYGYRTVLRLVAAPFYRSFDCVGRTLQRVIPVCRTLRLRYRCEHATLGYAAFRIYRAYRCTLRCVHVTLLPRVVSVARTFVLLYVALPGITFAFTVLPRIRVSPFTTRLRYYVTRYCDILLR